MNPQMPSEIPFFAADNVWKTRMVALSNGDIPWSVKITITPAMAKDILANRNDNNRRVNRGRVLCYARDIIQGNWQTTHQGIGFDWNGQLHDGQHRLAAIVEADRPVEFMVAFGLDPISKTVVDEGRPRSTADAAKIIGVEIKSKALAAGNYLLEVKGLKARAGRTDVIKFIQRHQEPLEWSADRIRGARLVHAPIIAAVTRAYYEYHGDARLDRLDRFCEVYSEGMIGDANESAAVRLRNYVIGRQVKKGDERKELYRKTIAALQNFMQGNPISRLYGTDDDIYKLPEERMGQPLIAGLK